MRTNANVQVGQRWESGDRRRLSCFDIVSITADGMVTLRSIYPPMPPNKGLLSVRLERFLVTGSDGYTRIS